MHPINWFWWHWCLQSGGQWSVLYMMNAVGSTSGWSLKYCPSETRTMLNLRPALWDLLQDHAGALHVNQGCRILIQTNFLEKSHFWKGPRTFLWASQGFLGILVLLQSLPPSRLPSLSLSTAPDLHHHVKGSSYLVLSSLSNKSLANVILSQCDMKELWHDMKRYGG